MTLQEARHYFEKRQMEENGRQLNNKLPAHLPEETHQEAGTEEKSALLSEASIEEIQETETTEPATQPEQASMLFSDFKLNKQLLSAIEEMGYVFPTPIQQEAIPKVLAGHDVLAVAQTGTGKTAAFLLPTLMKIKYAQGTSPRALVVTPTRELALQIADHAHKLATHTDLRIAVLYGGKGIKKQIADIETGTDLIVATPGRLWDIYVEGGVWLKEIRTLILDEADRLMDMGFMPQIRQLLEVVPPKRQNLLFSATFPQKVERLAEEFLDYPLRIEVTPQATTAETIEQVVYKVPNFQTKVNLLTHLLKDEQTFNRLIVFARSRQTVNQIARQLGKVVGKDQIRIVHANKGQNTRINALNEFSEGGIRILATTDVAARGLDVADVSHVVNFEVPLQSEEYVHRIGRTGRAGKPGAAITFMNPAEEHFFAEVENTIKEKVKEKQLPPEVTVAKTPPAERQIINLAIDKQRRRADPTFKGAFHEKKARPWHKNKRKKTNKAKSGSGQSKASRNNR